MNSESANRFIAALVKSLQTLCHGYVDFDDGIEIIGHLYLNIDSGATFDYVLKEKVCKNAENSTVFVSKSFHAEGKPENTLIPNDKETGHPLGNAQTAAIGDTVMSPSGTSRIQSAISNLSNVLAVNNGHQSAHTSHLSNAGKRKREQHQSSYNNQHAPPFKYTTLQSSSSSAMPYFSNPINIKQQHSSSSRDSSKHYDSSQGEFFGGDSNQSSALGGDDEDDLHLDVTFVKEEYSERQRAGQISRTHQDPSNQNLMAENAHNSGGYHMGYHPSTQSQHFSQQSGSGSTTIERNNMSQMFQEPPHSDAGQQHLPPLPNPRTHLSSQNDSGIDSFMAGENTKGSIKRIPGTKVKVDSLIHTIRQNKWAVTRAREWLSAQGMPIEFEQFTDEQLNDMLLKFYTSAQKKDGSPFSGTALLAFRTAMTRHMNEHGRIINLASANIFKPSNAVLSRIMSCSVKVNRVISTADIILLYNSGTLNNSNPESLLYKVWFELQVHMKGKVAWKKVDASHFSFSLNDSNKVCVTWNTFPLGGTKSILIQAIGGKYCPVESLKKYIQRRSQLCSSFLQAPGSPDMIASGIWYNHEEFRECREKLVMKKLSSFAKLSRVYTNSCILNSYEEYFHAMNSLTVSNL